MNNPVIKTNHIKYAFDHPQSKSYEHKLLPESNSLFVIKIDRQGSYTYANPFYCENFGLDQSALAGKFLTDHVIGQDHEAYRDTITNCLADHERSHWVMLRQNSCNRIISTYWECKVVEFESENLEEILCIGHDMNVVMQQQKLKSLIDATEEQNKKLIDFTYVISHNIRSHVANILGIIDLNETGTEEEREMSWNIIKQCALGLGATISNLNEIISIQTHHHLPVKRLYLIPELNRMMASVEMLFDKSNTTINYHFDESVFLDTNPAYLESIMLNLFTNAIKYRSPFRSLQIDLSLVSEDGYQILLFKDNGIGINLEKFGDKVFGMYKTFHGNADAKGMGLYIVKTQIEALGGKIEVESEVDVSTTFKVYFKQGP